MKRFVSWLILILSGRHFAKVILRSVQKIHLSKCISLLSSIRLLPRKIKTEWNRLPVLTKHIISNLIVGLLIAILIHKLHSNSFIEETENLAMDWMISMFSNTQVKSSSPTFTWIDIDEGTYQSWGEPFYTPRDRLAQLIKIALSWSPKVLFVDIDLSKAGFDRNEDDELVRQLQAFNEKCDEHQKNGSACPAIILVRTFRQVDNQNLPKVSTISRLEELVAESQFIFWAHPEYESGEDGIVRYWRQWKSLCGDTQTIPKTTTFPSVQLMIGALLEGRDPQLTQEYVQEKLYELNRSKCSDEIGAHTDYESPESENIEFMWGDLELTLSEGKIARRILFHIPGSNPSLLTKDGRPVIQTPSAQSLLAKREVPVEAFKNDVVLIGASYPESRDIYMTPIGNMPGVLIIANAILSLKEYGEISPPPLWAKLVIEAFLILLMSVAFAKFDSFTGMLLSGFVVILALLPISFFVYRYGVWLDFAVPLIAVQIHQMASDLEKGVHKTVAIRKSKGLAQSSGAEDEDSGKYGGGHE